MKRHFKNKVIVITGATGGIGTALVHRFAQAQARIALIDLDQNLLDGLKDRLNQWGIESVSYICDISNADTVEKTFSQIIHDFGSIDVLINNAAITHNSNFVDTEIPVFNRVMDVNYFGALYCTKQAIPHLQKNRGIIISISSLAGIVPQIKRSGYSASKYALHGLFESIREEIKPCGIDVLIICPSFTRTDLNRYPMLADGSKSNKKFSLTGRKANPSVVADKIFSAATMNKKMLILSGTGKLAHLLGHILPQAFIHSFSNRLND